MPGEDREIQGADPLHAPGDNLQVIMAAIGNIVFQIFIGGDEVAGQDNGTVGGDCNNALAACGVARCEEDGDAGEDAIRVAIQQLIPGLKEQSVVIAGLISGL